MSDVAPGEPTADVSSQDPPKPDAGTDADPETLAAAERAEDATKEQLGEATPAVTGDSGGAPDDVQAAPEE